MTASAVVNVNNIYIASAILEFVKRAPKKSAHVTLSGCPRDRMKDRQTEPAQRPQAFDLAAVFVRWRSPGPADKSAPRLREDPPPTSAACAARHRRAQTGTQY